MKYLTFILAGSIITLLSGCTTVNVYHGSEPIVVIIKDKPSARNPDNPYR